jgi:hypothetical protein
VVISSRPGTSPARRRATARKGHPTLALRTHRPAAPGARRKEITTPARGAGALREHPPHLSMLGGQNAETGPIPVAAAHAAEGLHVLAHSENPTKSHRSRLFMRVSGLG